MDRVIFSYQGDCTDKLERFIKDVPDGIEIAFEEGEYYLSRKVQITKKTNITINGNGSVIITRFDPQKGFDDYSGAFGFSGCCGITLKNFVFDTDKPVNSAGKVVSVDCEKLTFDAEIFEDCLLDGGQTIRAINSIDCDGSPDYLLSDYGQREYEVLSKNLVRVFCSEEQRESLKRISVGTNICFRFGLWSYKTISHATITFENCKDTAVEDITVYSSPGGMLVVFPRCENFTLKGYIVKCPKDSSRLMASNVDAAHFLGLAGRLHISDSYFDGLGDDALNIHSTLGTITEIYEEKIVPINKRFDIPLEENWCRAGDEIRIYTPDFVQKGSFKVKEYDGRAVYFSELKGDICRGDIIANTMFFAETLVENCEVRNTRARALLFQTENITVKNCRVFGTSLPAILLAPDSEFWQEAGPVKNVVIENCRFEKCAFPETLGKDAVIAVRCSHSGKTVSSEPIHSGIKIKNNTFLNNPKSCFDIVAAQDVEIKNNIFVNCKEQLS